MSLTVEQAIQQGLQSQQVGNLDHAEELYRNVLAVAPENAQAWHLWGAVAFQKNDIYAAADRMRRAIELDPNDSQFHSNLGLVLTTAGNFAEGEKALRTSLL